MIKRWKELSELPCVKEYGIRHKIAHIIGTASVTHCLMAHIGEGIREGFIEEKEGGMCVITTHTIVMTTSWSISMIQRSVRVVGRITALAAVAIV